MKKTTCGLAVVFLLVSGYAAQRGVLREGSSVTVRLSERLDSNKNKTDDQFQAILDSDLVSDGRALARAGSTAFGRLVEVQPSGRVSGRARMSLTLTAIQVDARVVPIETRTLTVEADPSKKKDAAVIGGSSALGAIIGAIAGGGKGAAIGAAVGAAAGTGTVLVMPGKEVEFEPEQKFSFTTARDVTFDQRSTRDVYPDRPGIPRRGEPGRVEDIARELNGRAQQLWEMVRSRRESLRRLPGDDGTVFYSAVGDFARLARTFEADARNSRRESLRESAGSLVSSAEKISGLVDRVKPRFRDDWRSVEDQVVRLSDSFNLDYRPSRELARSESGHGSFRWRGRVDGSDYIELRGDRVTIRHVQAGAITGATYDLPSPLPGRGVTVRLNRLAGRGKVELYQQPSAANDYTVIVYVQDEAGGNDLYEFELIW